MTDAATPRDTGVEGSLGPPDALDILDTDKAGPTAIRGGAMRIGGFALTVLFSLVSVPFMVRHLGPVDYGHFVTVSSIVFIIGGFTEAGLTNLGIREVSVLDGAERARFLRNLVGLRFGLTVPGIAIAVGLTAATGAAPTIVYGTAIVGLGLLLTLTQQTYVIPLNAQLRLGWVTSLEVLRAATLSGFFIGAVIVGAALVTFYWASVLAGAAMIAATLLLVRQHGSLRPSFDLSVWRRIVRETLPYAAAVAVGLIYFRIAVILMSYVSTGEETGIFSAAFRIVEVVAMSPWIVVSSAFPILARAARDDEARLGYALQRLFEMSLIIGSGLALGLAVAAPFAIAVVAGDGFDASIPVLRLQGLTLITAFLFATWSFALLSLKLYRQILIANMIAAVVAIAGTLALAPPLGAEGAALATLAAEAALAGACLYFLLRARPTLAPKLAVVPKVILAAGAAVAVSLAGHQLPSIVLAAIAGLVFGGILLATRAVPSELFRAIAGRDPHPSSSVDPSGP
ncbi:MAG: oligosaccharide flippase family protein [Solirubrobacterales bacterium]